MSAEADLEGALAPLELPRIAVVEPVFRKLDLPAVGDLLAEHAVGIAYAVAMRRYVDGRHRFHETGGQPAQAAIAERRVRLEAGNHVQFNAERLQGRAHVFQKSEIGESVPHQTPYQELERQIINAFFLLVVGFPGGFYPLVDDAVAHHLDRRRQPIMRRRNRHVLADPVFQGPQNLGCQRFGIGCCQDLPWELGCRHACHVRLNALRAAKGSTVQHPPAAMLTISGIFSICPGCSEKLCSYRPGRHVRLRPRLPAASSPPS